MTTTATSMIETELDTDFDFGARVDALRCHPTPTLRARVAEARREQQRWRLEELAATRVLDDRGALDGMPDSTISARTARTNVEVARGLERLPRIAAGAFDGSLSWDQVQPLVQLATPETDGEWAERGARLSPGELQRTARRAQVVTAADAALRRELRSVVSWREDGSGMTAGRWRLPDVDGVLVDKVLDHMAERMRPGKGMAWDSLAHRKADALVELARSYADVEPTGRFRFEIVEIHESTTTARGEVEGIPVAAETLSALRPEAKVRECAVDDTGRTRTIRRPRTALPVDVERQIRRRDLACRVPGCEATRRLQVHHTDPVCTHGDTHDPAKLAAVCPHHHQMLEPHGPYRLVGDANDPDGLRLVHRDDRARDGPAQ
jgi:Domain of unknown function (DUF222)